MNLLVVFLVAWFVIFGCISTWRYQVKKVSSWGDISGRVISLGDIDSTSFYQCDIRCWNVWNLELFFILLVDIFMNVFCSFDYISFIEINIYEENNQFLETAGTIKEKLSSKINSRIKSTHFTKYLLKYKLVFPFH